MTLVLKLCFFLLMIQANCIISTESKVNQLVMEFFQVSNWFDNIILHWLLFIFRHFQIPKVLEINWQNMNFKTQKQQRKNAKLNSCLWFLPSICSWEDSSEKWKLSLYATQLLKSKHLIVKSTPWQNSYYVDLTTKLRSFVVPKIH